MTASLLFGRQIEVRVAGFIISEPRISFELDRQIDNTQDKGSVTIYNLRPGHADRIHEREGRISVAAGYPGTVAIVFEGLVQRVIQAREHLAHVTRIQLGDEVRRKGRLGGYFSRVYDGPVPVRQIAQDIIRAIGLPAGPLDAIPPPATVSEWRWAGPADAALDLLLRRVGCTWYEFDGIIRINRPGEPQTDAPTIRVSARNGMIGIPIETDEGAEVRMFLNPLVVLGCIVEIESRTLGGRWKVVGLRHAGDNWQGPFETFCDLRLLD